MGKKAPAAPAAPDPVATAQAQGAMNKETAIANAELGMVNQYTPYGNLIFSQRGTSAAGTPQYESRTELSPEQQKLLEMSQKGDLGTAQLGLDQLGRITNAVSTPFSFGGLPSYGEQDQTAAAAKAEEALMARLNPQFQRDEEALRTRLVNQGIGVGSEAYKTEIERFNQAKNDARQQAVLGGQQYGNAELAAALQRRNQGIQEYTTQRNAPLNEYSALTSGTQIQNPQFASSQQGNIAPVDYAGLVNQNYQNQLGQYNQQVAGQNSRSASLFGLGGQLGGSFLGSKAGSAAIASIPALFSDAELKENIIPVGTENGHQVYEFNYIGSDSKYIGVMAQDVEKYMPEAVSEIDGYKAVNYGMLGLEMRAV
jgi:hypothetical protein